METRLRLRRRLLRIDDSYLGDESENNDEDEQETTTSPHHPRHQLQHTQRQRPELRSRASKSVTNMSLHQSFDQLTLRATNDAPSSSLDGSTAAAATATASNLTPALTSAATLGASSSRYVLKPCATNAAGDRTNQQPVVDEDLYKQEEEQEEQEDDVNEAEEQEDDMDEVDDADDEEDDDDDVENNNSHSLLASQPHGSSCLPAIRSKAEKCETSQAIKLLYSRFDASRPPTVCFDYPTSLQETRSYPMNAQFHVVNRTDYQLCYKTHWERNCVKNAFAVAGFQRTKKKWKAWHVAWAKHMPRAQFKRLETHQIFNHFPDPWIIGRKDRLMKTLTNAKRRFGASYAFFPEGYALPGHADALRRALNLSQISSNKHIVWIVKPPASACGRGIRVLSTREVEQLVSARPKKKIIKTPPSSSARTKNCVVQRYIANPFLVDGYKFDLRFYVLVTCVDPLRIYLFREGLVRFCTSKFNLETLKNRFCHLTNYAVNKKNTNYQENTTVDAQDVGSKWSWSALCRHYLEQSDEPQALQKVTQQIHEIVCKTIIAGESHWVSLMAQCVKPKQKCFELFGFDLMLDQQGKIWLIEVNVSPSLMGGSPLDRRVKGLLLSDIFHLVGVPVKCKEPCRASPPPPAPATPMNCFETRTRRERPASAASSRSSSGAFDGGAVASSTSISLARSNNRQLHDVIMDPEVKSLAKNHVELFGSHEWDQIVQLEDEMDRLGHFERVFPCESFENTMQVTKYFNSPRYSNNLCAKWLNTEPNVRAEALRTLRHRRR